MRIALARRPWHDAAASLLGSAILLPAQTVVVSLLMVAALASGWRVIVNGRRATTALHDSARVLPELVAKLPPPVALAVEAAPSRVAVRTSGGILGGLLTVGCGLMVLILGAALISEILHGVPARRIGLLCGIHVMLVPLVLVLSVLLTNVHAAFDVAHDEVMLGVARPALHGRARRRGSRRPQSRARA